MWFNVRVFLISIWLSDGIFSISIYKPSDKIEKSYQSDDYDLGHNTCFPSSDHIISIPDIDQPIPNLQELNQWWCSHSSQYAWLGYSYSVRDCPTREEMIKSFRWMKDQKSARYVRIYGGCDGETLDEDIIEAAAQTGMGVYGLIWFGFDGDDKWISRRARLLRAIQNNKKAPYVFRAITLGSEPLFDEVLPLDQFVKAIKDLKLQLKPYHIPVTISDLPAGFKKRNNASEVFDEIDFISLHALPFFEGDANLAIHSFSNVRDVIEFGEVHGNGKLISITQTGWPSNTLSWPANSKEAIANLEQEQAYFDLLDQNCEYFKSHHIGWFSHVYNDTTVKGWGLLNSDGSEKITFNPQIEC